MKGIDTARLAGRLLAVSGLIAFAAAPARAQDAGEVLAEVDGEKITLADVKAVAASQLQQLEQQRYELLRQAVDQVINTRLVEAAAEAAGLSVEEFYDREVMQKIPEPTEDEVKAFYERYKNHQQVRGKTLDETRGLIVQSIKAQKQRELTDAFVARLRDGRSIRVLLDPPRVDVAEDGNPALGAPGAPVTIVEFSDFQCPYCRRAEETLKKVRETYGDKVRVVFRDFPLDFHPHAQKAAEAAGCAQEQGKFWEMAEKLFENQQALAVENLRTYADQIGLDRARFDECLDSAKREAEVKADLEAGQALGVSGTPAFFINGRLLSGAASFEQFAEIIEDELARTSAASGGS